MAYTVLARKYRSRTFDEVVGQTAAVTTLRNAIRSGRIHHGYLFCGTRGVGKTSLARILAKALNCLAFDAPTTDPCGKCDSCRMIADGEDLDVIEIDAASNTGVDNIRELRSNSTLRPARGRFKVYIIDEVHMLSTGAFNALLKTLEEPPAHVKFILATTDVHKVPATIQSRVQRFEFTPLSVDEISGQLERICRSEKVKSEPAALRRIARLATGSMRDALSLADQVISLCGNELTEAALQDVLPPAHDEQMAELIARIAAGDAAGALAVADRALSRGESADPWCGRLIAQLRDLMVMRVCGAETDLVDAPGGLRERLAAQAGSFDAGTYVYFITLAEELRRSVRSSGAGRALVDAAIVRMAEAPRFTAIESLLARVEGAPSAAAPRPAAPPLRPAAASNTPKPVVPPLPPRKSADGAPPADKKKEQLTGATNATPVPPAFSTPETRPQPRTVASDRTRGADLEAAYAEPAVQQAMDILGGKLVGVSRRAAVEPAAPEAS